MRNKFPQSLFILVLAALLPSLLLGYFIGLVEASSLSPNDLAFIEASQPDVYPGTGSRPDAVSDNTAPFLDPDAKLTLRETQEDSPDLVESDIAAVLAVAGDPITDMDDDPEGIAVFGADNTHGEWQYKIADSWEPFGVVTHTAAVLLNDAAFIRFVPQVDYFGPSGNLDIRAWDQTTGKNGERVNTSVPGGSTAFSSGVNKISTSVLGVNDAPVLGGHPTNPLTYFENAALFLWPLLTVTDNDSPMIVSATIELLNYPDGDTEKLEVTVGDTGLIAIPETGKLKVSGDAAPAVYEAVLRTALYRNTSQDPDVSDRSIRMSVTDNQGSESNTIQILVHVVSVDDPPVLDLDGTGPGVDFQTIFFINRGPVPIVADSLEVSDVDDTKIKSAEIKILNPGSKEGDVLRATNFLEDNITVIPYDIDTGILSLTGDDTIANYQKVLRTLTYDNIHKEPDVKTRSIQFVLTDFNNDLKSDPRLTTVELQQAPPVIYYFPVVAPDYRQEEEPNDTCAQALGIVINSEYNFQADVTEDWYFFNTQSQADVTVVLKNFAEGQIIIYSAEECSEFKLLGNNGDNQSTKYVNLEMLPAGRYYIRIIYDGGLVAAPVYQLSVQAIPKP